MPGRRGLWRWSWPVYGRGRFLWKPPGPRRGPLRATVNEEGKTRLKQRFVVSAPVSGQLRRIPFKAGAQVEAGQTVLAVLDPLAPVPLDARARALAEARKDAARRPA